ncbi:uncharacterized protein CC84DRAFT_1079243 [Paraphaeosphaeria sporulosa]|uniref:Uncharacterized protein n=1 Tax=Paraphaeosphaeria sporulosa TaxID=1460663 RepID=A0A177CYL5_9PLEO|nr:uncharacterized protein CC84DRAFT_1079243 [Paraphaeosphaeria sporulosa]OAG12118.1 hypothetical protein CC84DRAFT_1079243 [Paraphaeosphaeria sporulosa]
MNKLRSFILAFDVVFHSSSLMFVALALIAARIDGKEVSQYGQHLQQVLLLSPTIFPVIFAALMGRCFKYLGLNLAERGTTLGRLEQLIGSTSLFSALERQISLRGFSLIGYILMILWLLSPLGGQSALRLMGEETNSVFSNGTIQYLNPDTVVGTAMGAASDINSARSVFSPIFLASLLSSSKYQDTSMDLWGNVKMPRFASVESSTSDEWKTIKSDNNTNITYASLIGIPVAQLDKIGASNFSVKARQWDVDCDKNEMQGGKQADFGSMDVSTWKVAYTPVNSSCSKWPCSISFKSMANNDAENKDYFNYTVASCKLSYDAYETRISCKGRSCIPTAIRKVDSYIGVNYTRDTDAFFRNTPAFNTMITLPRIDNLGVGSVAFRGSTNAEKWMADPTNFVGLKTYVQLYELSPEVLSNRLTILWNSFFQSTYAMNTLGGNLDQTFDNTTQSTDSQLFNGTASTISTPMPSVWKLNWKWFTALLVSSIILQIAAYMGLFFKYYTCVPDIIGYASSMTLLNPYVPTPTGGTTLHGLERTHMLQDMKVMIGDVCANETIGAVAFAKADEGRVARLTRRRLYV